MRCASASSNKDNAATTVPTARRISLVPLANSLATALLAVTASIASTVSLNRVIAGAAVTPAARIAATRCPAAAKAATLFVFTITSSWSSSRLSALKASRVRLSAAFAALATSVRRAARSVASVPAPLAAAATAPSRAMPICLSMIAMVDAALSYCALSMIFCLAAATAVASSAGAGARLSARPASSASTWA